MNEKKIQIVYKKCKKYVKISKKAVVSEAIFFMFRFCICEGDCA